jgi:cytosine/creatinine deaminase
MNAGLAGERAAEREGAMGEAPEYRAMLGVALGEARQGLAEGGIPIGAAIFEPDGRLIAAGHNRRVQDGDPSAHAETDAFRRAGRQFGFGTVVVGESRNFQGGIDWLRSLGVKVIDLDSEECASLLAEYIRGNPSVWNEDIGEE